MYSFNYHRPSSLEEAKQALQSASDGKLVAGGMTLLPTMKQRLAMPSDLIDLGRLSGLKGIEEQSGKLVIGALTTHAEVAGSKVVKAKIPALAKLAEGIGDPQVRNCGTLGGSVANADPAADYPAAVVALNATIKTDKREIAADDFFKGLFETALEPGEILLSVSFPVPEKAGYAKFPNPASRYAIVGVFVARASGGPRVAVTGAGPSVYREKKMEQALAQSFSPEALKSAKASAEGLNSDIHASAEYRAHLVGVMARRAVAAAG